VAALIDHTLLKPDATASDIGRLCAEAREWSFASVCVNPYWVAACSEILTGGTSRVCTVLGFPLGANLMQIKAAEARAALDQGATELDVVQNIGALRSGQYDFVRDEIRELADLAHSRNAILKVILENCLLTDDQKVTSCILALDGGADFVKTSTGFSTSGATIPDVKLMCRTVDSKAGVKASGGVRSLEALRQMVRAGASRIGTSSGVNILRELSLTPPEAAI
jgi:deoxyribose-phosphate aldolase